MASLWEKLKSAGTHLSTPPASPDMEDAGYLPNQQMAGQGAVNLLNAAGALSPDPIHLAARKTHGVEIPEMNWAPAVGGVKLVSSGQVGNSLQQNNIYAEMKKLIKSEYQKLDENEAMNRLLSAPFKNHEYPFVAVKYETQHPDLPDVGAPLNQFYKSVIGTGHEILDNINTAQSLQTEAFENLRGGAMRNEQARRLRKQFKLTE